MDQEIWKKIREGDQSALVILYKKMYQVLLNYGSQYTDDHHALQDHIQQLFLQLWEQHEKLPEVRYVRTYIYHAFRNRLLNQLKKKSPRLVPVTEVDMNVQFAEMSYLEKMLNYQQDEVKRARLGSALARLTPRQLELLEMRFFLQMSYDEMEASLGISRKTIYNIIFMAIELLRDSMLGDESV